MAPRERLLPGTRPTERESKLWTTRILVHPRPHLPNRSASLGLRSATTVSSWTSRSAASCATGCYASAGASASEPRGCSIRYKDAKIRLRAAPWTVFFPPNPCAALLRFPPAFFA
jgi:hypothetical protein